MSVVKFTQWLFPDRTPSDVSIERPDDICKRADALREAGCTFDIENQDGRIWMTCYKDGKEDEMVDKFCRNGPDVLLKVDELVNTAYERFIEGKYEPAPLEERDRGR